MTETATVGAYREQIEPATVRLERMLPGPVERVWAYLTESELRGRWLATGDMDLKPGGRFEFVWRNDDLTGRLEDRPDGFEDEHRMESAVVRLDPPRLLVIGWEGSGDVTFELEPVGSEVRLTLTHRRLPDRGELLGVSAGWHAHLEVLVARLRGTEPPPFWKTWVALKAEYDERLT